MHHVLHKVTHSVIVRTVASCLSFLCSFSAASRCDSKKMYLCGKQPSACEIEAMQIHKHSALHLNIYTSMQARIAPLKVFSVRKLRHGARSPPERWQPTPQNLLYTCLKCCMNDVDMLGEVNEEFSVASPGFIKHFA